MAKARRIRDAIRLCADTVLLARMLIRERERTRTSSRPGSLSLGIPSARMPGGSAQTGEDRRVTGLKPSSLPARGESCSLLDHASGQDSLGKHPSGT
jgi:hypothetical protein